MGMERNIIKRLREDAYIQVEAPVVDDNSNLISYARIVMTAYQNANRWLDSIKESILIDYNCPYFSKIVHDLAHTMPVRFDSFGDILHTINLKVPYPSTEEYPSEVKSIKGYINDIYSILDSIKESLLAFKKVVEGNPSTAPMSIICDPLLSDIQEEYEYYIRVESQLPYYGSNLAHWDKKAYEIYNAKKDGKIE